MGSLSVMLAFLIVIVSGGEALAQLDTNFEPRTFAGSPTLARAVGQPTKAGGPTLFRNYRFDSNGVLMAIEQGTDAMGTTLEVAFEGCTELITVETMRERKRIMVERGDAFLVLPGGLGTYEELFETLVGRVLSEHDKPMGIVNDHGYFDPLLAMIEHGIEQKFIRPAIRRLLSIDRDPVKVLHDLATDRGHGLSQSDLIPPLAELET